VFNQRVQQFVESIAELRKLEKSCEFGDLEDSLIRDRVVVGIRDDTTRRRQSAATEEADVDRGRRRL